MQPYRTLYLMAAKYDSVLDNSAKPPQAVPMATDELTHSHRDASRPGTGGKCTQMPGRRTSKQQQSRVASQFESRFEVDSIAQ